MAHIQSYKELRVYRLRWKREAEEVRVWLEFSHRCGYMSETAASELDHEYNRVIAQLVRMIDRPEQWTINKG